MKRLLFVVSLGLILAILAACAPGTSGGGQQEGNVGGFYYGISQNLMTDANNSYALTYSTRDKYTDYLDFANLLWHCGPPGAILVTKRYLSDKKVVVRYRFDKNTPSAWLAWDVSADGTTVIVPASLYKSFTNAALNAKGLVMEVGDYRGVVYIYQFKLDDLAGALAKIGCKSPSSGKS